MSAGKGEEIANAAMHNIEKDEMGKWKEGQVVCSLRDESQFGANAGHFNAAQ